MDFRHSICIKNDFKPVFVDINLDNLSMDIEQVKSKINKNTLAIFLTHAQGFNGLNNELLEIVKKKNIFLIEDVCSHMELHLKIRSLKFWIISNFSFIMHTICLPSKVEWYARIIKRFMK